MNKNRLIIVATVIVFLLTVIIISLLVGENTQTGTPAAPGDTQQGCTQEAKLCPDGSAVGREGPNCEFTACPNDAPASKI